MLGLTVGSRLGFELDNDGLLIGVAGGLVMGFELGDALVFITGYELRGVEVRLVGLLGL